MEERRKTQEKQEEQDAKLEEKRKEHAAWTKCREGNETGDALGSNLQDEEKWRQEEIDWMICILRMRAP